MISRDMDEAVRLICDIQRGVGLGFILHDIPKDMIGDAAKDKWNDATFTLGAEYGAIGALMYLYKIRNGELK